jgi:hypothetical protein
MYALQIYQFYAKNWLSADRFKKATAYSNWLAYAVFISSYVQVALGQQSLGNTTGVQVSLPTNLYSFFSHTE